MGVLNHSFLSPSGHMVAGMYTACGELNYEAINREPEWYKEGFPGGSAGRELTLHAAWQKSLQAKPHACEGKNSLSL